MQLVGLPPTFIIYNVLYPHNILLDKDSDGAFLGYFGAVGAVLAVVLITTAIFVFRWKKQNKVH